MSRVLGNLLRRQVSSGTRIIAASSRISDTCHSAGCWYGEPNAISNVISFAKSNSGSHDAVIRVYDEAGNVVETHEEAGWLPEKHLPHQSIA
jgi:hypothetical protein